MVVAVVALWIGVLWLRGEVDNPVARPVARGVEAPDFTLPRLDGGPPVSLQEKRGEVVLLNFWATWCKPCEDEMPAMDRLYRSLQSENFELLAVSVDEDPDTVKAFRQRLGMSFPILLDPEQHVSSEYQTTGFPETLLIDQSGMILERYVGPRDWDHATYANRIRELLSRG